MLSGASAIEARPTSTCQADAGRRVWREVELLLLVFLVLGVYFSRLTSLTIRGEESRWARVAQEMIETGDWIVPRQQGHPFPDRPPLNSWAMIGASKVVGQLNLTAIRLPAVTATLLTTLLIYIYARNFLGRVGSFAGAAGYATMIQVLQLGRHAESDSLLTLCVTASLLVWHWGYACRANAKLAWVIGYGFAALAGLAKGPQGPIYFVAITSTFLCLRRDWRFLFSRWHLAGFAVFALVLGSWQLPFLQALDSASMQQVWSEGGEIGTRFQYRSLGRAFGHWGSYPFEVLACMLPWSCMVPVIASRWFRQSVGRAGSMVAFLLIACAVAFPTCWLPADTRARYFMSLYPCMGLLIGAVIERCWESSESGWWPESWDRFLRSAAAIIAVATLGVALVATFGASLWSGMETALSVPFLVCYVVIAAATCSAILWSRKTRDLVHARVGILGVAGFLGLSYTGLMINFQQTISNDPSDAVLSVRDMIPSGEHLTSFGPVHHLFAYYYREPIALEELIDDEAPAASGASYFCFSEDPGFPTAKIPFEWDEIAVICCDRARSERPLAKVIVGKRRWSGQHVNYTSSEESAECDCENCGSNDIAEREQLTTERLE